MCPPPQTPPPAEIGSNWSDEQIISLLDGYKPGSSLPNNVLADSSPYQYPPSNLPEGIWYLLHSNEKKECVDGFWKAKGESCKIYSNSKITGWRTTLEYFEGQAPHGQKTNWHMQEYRITQKELCDKDKPKVRKESRSLCRVFLCSGHKGEMHSQNCITVVGSTKVNSVTLINPEDNITSHQDSKRDSKRGHEAAVLPVVADTRPNSSPQGLSELDYILRGDYLELDDLEDPESHSSSSQNSSCPSKLSDEYFDSSAFLRDLEEEVNSFVPRSQCSSRYSFTASLSANDVILQPVSLGSVSSASIRSNVVEGPVTSSTIPESLADKRVQEHTTKRQNPESRNEGASNFSSLGSPSTSNKSTARSGEKKAGAGRMKKLKTYFCFSTF
ncbi:NAC transcription factor 29-like isoform X2 [Sesamum indicum]|uniref:NAC transcription factor 29-like isoform X2 n=1 Tax=Sesamum indicum TaxID=4182 RepID=A0A6I9SV97_SESIN|nr:NAC transcription factor 29-like isoform X2 [Sesamum indicum]